MNNMPKLLWHYTSIDAFKGIIDNECLFMTKYDQLNDSSEVEYARNIMLDYLHSFHCDSRYQQFKNWVISVLENYINRPLFITSFSEKEDDLDQWRAYVPEEGGVAIGFDSYQLKQGFLNEYIPKGTYIKERGVVEYENGGGIAVRHICSFFKCRYGAEETTAWVNQQVCSWFCDKSYAGNFNRLKKTHEDSDYRRLLLVSLSVLDSSLYRILGTTKHHGFFNEKEWRWINSNPRPNEFSVTQSGNKKEIVKAKIHPADCITEVWISPHGDTTAIKASLEPYQLRLRFEIHESKIPFKNNI